MNSKKITMVMLAALAVVVSLSFQVYASNTQDINYTTPQQTTDANLAITVLKYEGFPVNAGDWFDLWIKAENYGQNDAKDAQFELITEYPFSSNDSLIRNFGLVYGTANSYKVNKDTDSSQVIMKFRVKVDSSAPEGISNIKIRSIPDASDPTSTGVITSLPIEIAKTKTDFDVKLSDVTPQETSLVVTNIGDNSAKSVTVNVKTQDGINFLKESEPAVLGDLDKGDFTIAHMKVVPDQTVKSMTLEISYTDTANVRNTIEKTVTLDSLKLASLCSVSTDNSYLRWTYGIIGLIIGAFVITILVLLRQKKHATKQASR